MFYFSLFYPSMWLSLLLIVREIANKWCLFFFYFFLESYCRAPSQPFITFYGMVHCWGICLTWTFSVVSNESRIVVNHPELSSTAGGACDPLQFNQRKTCPHTKENWNRHFCARLNKYLLLANGIEKCNPSIQRDGILKEKTIAETSHANRIRLVPDVLTTVWKWREWGTCPSAVSGRLRERSGKIWIWYSLYILVKKDNFNDSTPKLLNSLAYHY